MANEALIRYRGDAYPYDWETRDTDCSTRFVDGYFWIHDPEVYASLRFLIGNTPSITTLSVDRLIPHFATVGGRAIHGTHRYNPAGDDYLPVMDGWGEPGSVMLGQDCRVYFWRDRVVRIAEERGIVSVIDESSLPIDAILALERQRKEALVRWHKKSLWSEAELRDFCCGMFPDLARTNTAELNDAKEAIMRAVLAKELPCMSPADATTADRMYGHARFFRPDDAIRWANTSGLFPEFPFPSPVDTPPEGKELSARELTTYENIIGGLLGLMLGKTPAGNNQSVYESQNAIKAALLAHYPGLIGGRTIDEKFAAANRSISASKTP